MPFHQRQEGKINGKCNAAPHTDKSLVFLTVNIRGVEKLCECGLCNLLIKNIWNSGEFLLCLCVQQEQSFPWQQIDVTSIDLLQLDMLTRLSSTLMQASQIQGRTLVLVIKQFSQNKPVTIFSLSCFSNPYTVIF